MYRCSSTLEEDRAIREITQEVVLATLARTDFFRHAAFQGGTCLRVLHGLARFRKISTSRCRLRTRRFGWSLTCR